MKSLVTPIAPAVLLAVVAVLGCTEVPDTNVESHTESAASQAQHDILLTDAEIEALKEEAGQYEDAIAKIASYRDTIRDAIAADDSPKAHRSLDELDIILEHVPTAARNSD